MTPPKMPETVIGLDVEQPLGLDVPHLGVGGP